MLEIQKKNVPYTISSCDQHNNPLKYSEQYKEDILELQCCLQAIGAIRSVIQFMQGQVLSNCTLHTLPGAFVHRARQCPETLEIPDRTFMCEPKNLFETMNCVQAKACSILSYSCYFRPIAYRVVELVYGSQSSTIKPTH